MLRCGSVTDSKTVLILNGPNLNMLGTREPEIYGKTTLAEIDAACRAHAESLGLKADCRQSNDEAELIGWIQGANRVNCAIIINAGAYTHTSIALLDALGLLDMPIVEVHLSNIFSRESFRRRSYISAAATGIISGFGMRGYLLALDAIDGELQARGHEG